MTVQRITVLTLLDVLKLKAKVESGIFIIDIMKIGVKGYRETWELHRLTAFM